MQFVYPAFLWAFLLLAIPIAVHLFRFRRYKTVYFSNVRFLKNIQQESTAYNRLKHLLILAMRLLALSALILAFAQPYFPGSAISAGGKNYVSIFIDNSFSMNRLSDNFSLLDKAKSAATAIVKSFDDQDRFQILTQQFSGAEIRQLSKEEALSAIEEITFSSASRKFSDIIKMQSESFIEAEESAKQAFVLSDFQKSMMEESEGISPKITTNLLCIEAAASENISVDTCYFTEPFQMPGRNISLVIKIRNYGTIDANAVSLSAFLNGQIKLSKEISVSAGSFIQDTINFVSYKSGWNELLISIKDEPVIFDNTFYVGFPVSEQLKILSIADMPNKFIRAVFGKNDQFLLEETTPSAAPRDLSSYALVTVCNLRQLSNELSVLLTNYISSGGNLLLFPSLEADKDSYNKFLLSNGAPQIDGFSDVETRAADINLEQNIFKDVFAKRPENMRYPVVQRHVVFSKAISPTREDILKTVEGDLLVAKFTNGNGAFYLSAVPIDNQNSEMPQSPLFAPMLFKMAVLRGNSGPLVLTIGRKASFVVNAVPGKENVFRMKGAQTEFIPQQFVYGNTTRIIPGDELKISGFYRI
ncbi:MAG: BatA domain-containing protein, partial [Chitinophagales bacterium]|nr:BatA domain-containing protein [Chitinophagales bacterium]